MKLVINRCYGGFSLSPLAVKRLAELRGQPCYFFRYDLKTRKHSPTTEEDDWCWTAFTVPNPDEVLANENFAQWAAMSPEKRQSSNARYASIHLDNRPENRADPLLVQVVEELGGEAASGRCADLKVIEIPDGVQWELDEYDGVETVHEVHRSWS